MSLYVEVAMVVMTSVCVKGHIWICTK